MAPVAFPFPIDGGEGESLVPPYTRGSVSLSFSHPTAAAIDAVGNIIVTCLVGTNPIRKIFVGLTPLVLCTANRKGGRASNPRGRRRYGPRPRPRSSLID